MLVQATKFISELHDMENKWGEVKGQLARVIDDLRVVTQQLQQRSGGSEAGYYK